MQTTDTHHFNAVLEANTQSIYRICRIYATNPMEPQDLFQEVVIQLWKALPKFKAQSHINTWVYKIALNVCMRKKTQLQKKGEKTLSLEALSFEFAKAQNQDDSADRYKALYDCIGALREDNRQIVILQLEGLAYQTISDITGLSENYVAVKMKRIRKILLNCITPKLK